MKTLHKIIAVYANGEKILVYRDPVSGKLSLPEIMGKNLNKDLDAFASSFGEVPQVVEAYPSFTMVDRKGQEVVYHPFAAEMPFQLELSEYKELLDYEDFDKNQYEGPSFRAICRYFFFYPLLLGKDRTIPLEVEVADLTSFRLDCLKYFHRRVPKSERLAYAALANSIASPTRLNRAFVYLEKVYGFDEKDYLAYRERTRQIKEEIR